jgi:hypothetical protein
MVFSVIGAVILGGTLAWSSSKTLQNNTVSVGSLNWDTSFSPAPSGIIGPNGATNLVGHGSIANNGDFEIALNAGASVVIIKNVDAGHSACDANNFRGTVQSLFTDPIALGETVEDAYHVLMTVDEHAPNSCIGAVVTYDIRITVATSDNGPSWP